MNKEILVTLRINFDTLEHIKELAKRFLSSDNVLPSELKVRTWTSLRLRGSSTVIWLLEY